MGTAPTIADDLVGTAVDVLAQLAGGVAPGLRLPTTLGGHRVDADAHADLVFTLGLLYEAGVAEVGGQAVLPTIHQRLAEVDAERTHTFFSYRIAETARRIGGLDALDPATRDVVVAAADSTDWIPLLGEQVVPPNYAVVLARCESARAALGLDVDAAVLDGLLDRVEALLGKHPEGWLDDSHHGRGQVDMYTVDAYLFAEPFADRLGEVWQRGIRSAARLVEAVAGPRGGALPWGRSIGALAVCHTAELAGVLLRRDVGVAAEVGVDAPRWLGLARAAATAAPTWFAGGLVVAHKRRAPFRYRGPHRRLQMTLDCAGKLVAAALDLRAAAATSAGAAGPPAAAPVGEVFAPRDEWIGFGEGLGVWAHRDPRLGFCLPVVGGPGADYAPAPRHAGRFEVPTDQPLVGHLPVAWRGSNRFAPGGPAVRVEHGPDRLELDHDGFVASATDLGAEPDTLPGRRRAVYRVEGRTLRVDESLSFERAPGAMVVMVPETSQQPLHVTARGGVVDRITTVDVDGLAEWRSVEGELSAVHQVELRPAATMAFGWSVTAKLRVASTAHHHWYDQCLYGPLADRVASRPVPYHLLDRPDRLAEALADVDVLHLHWPEWFTGLDVDRARRVAATLAAIDVPVVWTQHNMAPHAAPDDDELYRPWAATAAGVIHHSEWGRTVITERYDFRDDALHRVIPHGHWGPLMASTSRTAADRAEAEAELGMAPCELRIGLIGAPRPGKDTQLLIDGFAACTRDDLQLLVLCHDGEKLPDDDRITAVPYDEVPRAVYDRRLATIDVLALPLDGGTYLTTGQAADAVGAGIPALVSPWPYLREVLGAAGIPYGSTAEDLTRTLDTLDEATLAAARAALPERQAALDWTALAEPAWQLLDEVAARAATRRPR